ncbi:MAG: molybdopterin-dependent oxidoreductase [Acidimicrobiaceae bacterium]|nr:molybdopterin-dependent oxidoreductase [Acidimicrobiaceae bacterium]MXW76796.1 molybdopterin-dependent oxidoreductase [Acidimicrobiaceae bacterium]MYD07730.1 molybdopterin-dependent oxidoreductase [Acidimicrobiaceae bacterium]MYI57150.1 molybdopterin-dependent oxidoreductase [Acidimicrobiaceae bacterium]
MNTSQHDDKPDDDSSTADDPTPDRSFKPPHRTSSGQLWWQGALAGAAAGGVALMFGQFVEALSETIPGLVLGMGEWILDITPGWAAEESIENLGPTGKASLLPGITIVALLAAAALGNASLRISRKIGVMGFAAFGILGGFTTARNPSSPALQSWFWSLVAAGLGIATLLFLLNRLRGPEEREQLAGPLADPLDPPTSRRAFLGWSAGAGAVAVGGFALSRAITPKSAAETARESITFSDVTTTTTTTPPTTTTAPPAAEATVTTEAITDIDGISSYVTPNDSFYIIDTALSPPHLAPEDWSLEIKGMVDNPYTLTWDELIAMPMEVHDLTLSCVSNPVGGPLVGNAQWLGVPLTTLLERARVQPGADQFVGKSIDDWTAGFPTDRLYDGRTALLAVGMNGEPLPISHGFPARLIVAGIYGYVSAVKWVTEIELTRWDDFDGYWIDKGWAKLGPMKTMSRIDVPRHGSSVPEGETVLAGVAWSPPRGIHAVEVSVDDGPWWQCDLAVPGNDETWAQWRTTWDATPGRHRIKVRAVDGTDEIQPRGPKSVAPDGAEGWHQVTVRVT